MKKQKLKITFIGQTFRGFLGTYVNNFQDEFRNREFIDILSFKSISRKLAITQSQII